MTIPNKTFLWMIPKWSLPATDGAKVATERLVRNMIRSGAIVDILCLGNPNEHIDQKEMQKKWGVRNVFYKTRPLPRSRVGKILFYIFKLFTRPSCPLTMTSFDALTIREFVHFVLSKTNYDYLFLDGLHLGAVFIEKKGFVKPENCKQVIYRAHNMEMDIWVKAALNTNNIFKKKFLFWQSRLVRKYEKMIIEGSDLVAPISLEDQEQIQLLVPKVKTHLTLMGMDFSHPLEIIKTDKIQLLFLGRLDWPPNKDGLKWFLDEVWPKIDQKEFHLHIAGSGNRQWLSAYSQLSGVTFHGFVADINELYSKTQVSIIPIFYGSGTRIKVIESYTKGRSVISTAMGVQGSGLRNDVDYTACETAEEWVQAIKNFKQEKSNTQVENAVELLKKNFDEFDVANGLYQRL